ncbi:hypothetical protein C7S17_2582 [Burkholderia thailandensis]|nr:hypothetical protein [Burkholderia thailandensis]
MNFPHRRALGDAWRACLPVAIRMPIFPVILCFVSFCRRGIALRQFNEYRFRAVL